MKKIYIIIGLILIVVLLIFIFNRPTVVDNSINNITITQTLKKPIDEFAYQYYANVYSNYKISVAYEFNNTALGSVTTNNIEKYWLIKYINDNWVFISDTEDYFSCNYLNGLVNLPNVFNTCKDNDGKFIKLNN